MGGKSAAKKKKGALPDTIIPSKPLHETPGEAEPTAGAINGTETPTEESGEAHPHIAELTAQFDTMKQEKEDLQRKYAELEAVVNQLRATSETTAGHGHVEQDGEEGQANGHAAGDDEAAGLRSQLMELKKLSDDSAEEVRRLQEQCRQLQDTGSGAKPRENEASNGIDNVDTDGKSAKSHQEYETEIQRLTDACEKLQREVQGKTQEEEPGNGEEQAASTHLNHISDLQRTVEGLRAELEKERAQKGQRQSDEEDPCADGAAKLEQEDRVTELTQQCTDLKTQLESLQEVERLRDEEHTTMRTEVTRLEGELEATKVECASHKDALMAFQGRETSNALFGDDSGQSGGASAANDEGNDSAVLREAHEKLAVEVEDMQRLRDGLEVDIFHLEEKRKALSGQSPIPDASSPVGDEPLEQPIVDKTPDATDDTNPLQEVRDKLIMEVEELQREKDALDFDVNALREVQDALKQQGVEMKDRTEVHVALQTEITELEQKRDTLNHEIAEVQKKQAEAQTNLQSAIAELEAKRGVLEGAVNDAEARLEQARVSRDTFVKDHEKDLEDAAQFDRESEEAFEEQQRKDAQLKSEIDQLELKRNSLQSEIDTLQERKDGVDVAIGGSPKEGNGTADVLDNQVEEMASLLGRYATMESAKQTLESECQAHLAEVQRLNEELKKLKDSSQANAGGENQATYEELLAHKIKLDRQCSSHAAEVEWLRGQVDALTISSQEELRRVQETIRTLETEREAARSTEPPADMSLELQQVRDQLINLQAAHDQLKADRQQLEEGYDALDNQLNTAHDTIQKHEKSLEKSVESLAELPQLREQFKTLQETHLRLEDEKKQLEVQNATLDADLASARSAVVEQEKSLRDEYSMKVEELEKTCSSLRGQLDALHKDKSDASDPGDHQQQFDDLMEKCQSLQRELDTTKAANAEHEHLLLEASQLRDTAAEAQKDFQSRIETMQESCQLLESKLNASEKDIKRLESEREVHSQGLGDVTKLNGEIASLKKQLKSAGDDAKKLQKVADGHAKSAADLETKCAELTKSLEGEKKEKRQLAKGKGTLEQELGPLKEEVKKLIAQVETQKQTAQQLQQKEKAQEKDLKHLREGATQAQMNYKELEGTIERLQEESKRLREQIDAENLAKDESKQAHEAEVALLAQAKAQFDEVQMLVDSERREKEHMSQAHEDTKRELVLLTQEAEALRHEVEAGRNAVFELQHASTEKVDEARRLAQDVIDLQDSHRIKTQEIAMLQREVESLTRTIEGHTTEMRYLQRLHDEKANELFRLQDEISGLKDRMRKDEEIRRQLEEDYDEVAKELDQLHGAYQITQDQLVTEKAANLPLRRSYDDRIREIKRLRDEVMRLQDQVHVSTSKRKSGYLDEGNGKDDRLRQERRDSKDKVTNGQEKQSRTLKKEEGRRLRRELSQSDDASTSPALAALSDLNNRIGSVAESVSDRWLGNSSNRRRSYTSLENSIQLQHEAAHELTPILGKSFTDFLSHRALEPRDGRDAALISFALQASMIQSIETVFTGYRAGVDEAGEANLRRQYNEMRHSQSQTYTSRWQAFAHILVRSPITGDASAHDRILKNIQTGFAAIYILTTGNADATSAVDDFAIELEGVSKAALKLSHSMAGPSSPRYETYVASPDQEFDDTYMEDILERTASTAGEDLIFCAVRMGLVEAIRSPRGTNGDVPRRPRVPFKCRVVSPGSVSRLLLNG